MRADQNDLAGERATKIISAAIALAAFVLYSLTAAPTAYWLDSGELAAAAFELGIPHPPGHPLFVLFGKLATLIIPVGSIAFRVHIACAATVAVCLWICGRVAATICGPRAWPAVLLGLPVIAVSSPFWFHGVRAEVYPLNALISVLIIWLGIRLYRDPRAWHIAGLAFLTGLGATNHHYLVAFLGPGVLFLVLSDAGRRRLLLKKLPISVLCFLLGLAPYLMIPIRAAQFPTVRWGDPTSLGGLAWLVSARAFQKTAARSAQVEASSVLENLARFLDSNLSWIVVILALCGLVILAFKHGKLAIGLALIVVFNLASQVLFDFDPTNPDVAGYFLVSVWICGVFSIVTLAWLFDIARQRTGVVRWAVRALAVMAIGLSIAILLPESWRNANLSDERSSDIFAEEIYAFTPTNGIIVPSYFETSFNLWYREVAVCERPDVAVIHRLFRTYPGYDAYLDFRYPDLGPAYAVPAAGGALNATWLVEQAASRGILLEPLPPDEALLTDSVRFLRERMLPAGLMLRLAPMAIPTGPFPPEVASADRAYWEHFHQTLDLSTRETNRNLAWIHYNRALLFIDQDRVDAASMHIDFALDLFPNDLDLLRLRDAL